MKRVLHLSAVGTCGPTGLKPPSRRLQQLDAGPLSDEAASRDPASHETRPGAAGGRPLH